MGISYLSKIILDIMQKRPLNPEEAHLVLHVLHPCSLEVLTHPEEVRRKRVGEQEVLHIRFHL